MAEEMDSVSKISLSVTKTIVIGIPIPEMLLFNEPE
jgi:hypothetical protein